MDRRDYYRDSRGGGRNVAKYDWQREAISMFKEYALPAIKAQGGKYLSKQLSSFASKKR
ncbi:hypothetical protein CC80DRAFT_486635 [Byssothecium circinans]|uniref:Uncharacterized protein n=1 Tax=Byssothecium circinans TaxID=147558 RepID=A0A6A5UH02_9PLEO|nr:hypothetical protein CC80DRAFT_486635 [Byssothecium circinans]